MKRALPLFHLVEGQSVLVLGDGEIAEAKAKLVTRAGAKAIRTIEEARAAQARLAFVGFENKRPQEVESVVQKLRGEGFLVNTADRPELCDFYTPSILRRDPVVVAIGTGGASAGLAKHLRLRLEKLIPARVGEIAKALFLGREQFRKTIPDASARRRALDRALGEGGALDVLDPDAAQNAKDWAEQGFSPEQIEIQQPGLREVQIELTSDDPDDLTIRQARWLGLADVIVLDGDVSEAVLDRARADAVLVGLNDTDELPVPRGLTVILRGQA